MVQLPTLFLVRPYAWDVAGIGKPAYNVAVIPYFFSLVRPRPWAGATRCGGAGADLERWRPVLNYRSASSTIDYSPWRGLRALADLRIYPHLKFYWLSVNYGMVEEAHAAGRLAAVWSRPAAIPNLSRQILRCATAPAAPCPPARVTQPLMLRSKTAGRPSS